MVLRYLIYKATFTTKKKTKRSYIGYTGNLNLRKMWHELKKPVWMKPKESKSSTIEVLEDGIPSKDHALAMEAIHAARAIKKDSKRVRGGPWLRPTLDEGWKAEVEAVARMTQPWQLSVFAEAQPRSRLRRHLEGLTFLRAGEEEEGDCVWRGAVVKKRRSGRSTKSGIPGNASRKDQVRRGVLKKPGAWLWLAVRLARAGVAGWCQRR